MIDPWRAILNSPAQLPGRDAGISMGNARAIAQKFKWSDYKTFADVGTAQGCVPVQLALAHPHLNGTGFDLPVVKPVFEEYVASHKLNDRVRFAPGDFFKGNCRRRMC